MNTTLILIDPQNDFCEPTGQLFVPGADADCARLASFITAHSDEIDSIHITLDSHDYYNIAHPVFWKDKNGMEPAPYTVISSTAFAQKEYTPRNSEYTTYAEHYIAELEKKGRYQLVVWPPHCIIGTWGACVHNKVNNAVREWQKAKKRPVDYVIKGKNPLTEHYSAIEAEVPVQGDTGTQTNTALIASLKKSDCVLAAGQALSHCVAFTVRDIASHIGADSITLLEDCSSSVAGFEQAGNAFVQELCKQGMKTRRSAL
jgi:nicotinamidase-related amidase